MDLENIFNTFLNKGVETFKTNLFSTENNIQEPDNIDNAIVLYTKRLEELLEIKNAGFDTISEFKNYQKAQEVIREHEKRKSEKII